MAITRLWFFTLRPTTKANDPAFLTLWANILDLCASYTPTPITSTSQVHLAHIFSPHKPRPHHFLLQSSSSSSSAASTRATDDDDDEGQEDNDDEEDQNQNNNDVFVLISNYPSLVLCSQADAVYASKYRARVSELVEHRALRQLDMEDAELVPALISSSFSSSSPSSSSLSSSSGGRGGGGGDGGGITVTISNRDPLRLELSESGRRKVPVPSLNEEISGADVFELPAIMDGGGGGGGRLSDGKDEGTKDEKRDIYASQRTEGRKWIRISKRLSADPEDGENEVFRLREVLSR